ncbi:glycosyltransferase family 2 protein [Rhodoferax sp. U11-2br]|uniref:glycosyltransferase family 2 protein n=1 Tax=Rhodoferax sp. U11-2br TaxID=2838878 RepID=UPI001BE5A3C0|nr:glycosyltransferase family 2 protein [Rhodoferax sp. U11-2br]MBT3067042.1 glycosyltransferase [Rhodoferax sp. U11-2br]
MRTNRADEIKTSAVPKISVCIPTYCGGLTIGAAIESVLAQSLTDFELIVIDDGSTDNTRAIVESYSDPRLQYFHNAKNLGPQGNWNRCLELANGEYFKLLPHDDLLHPQCLARQAAALDADHQQNIALVFSARDVIGPSGKRLTRRGYPNGHEGPINGSSVMRTCVRRGTNLLGEPGAVLLRKTLADKVGPFDATNPYVIDLDYWFRLLTHGDAYFCVDSLASFRVSPQSWSVTIGGGQDRDFIHFAKRMYASHSASITATDMSMMQVTSRMNKWLRLAFYSIFLKQK